MVPLNPKSEQKYRRSPDSASVSLISIAVARNAEVTVPKNPQMKIKSLKKQKC